MGQPYIRRQVLVLLAALTLLTQGIGLAASQQTPTAAPPAGNTPENHLGKGYDALKQDQYEVAAGEFRAALELDPTLTLRARFPLAVALFEEHKSDEARRELEIVRGEVGDHPNVLYYLGRLDLDEPHYGHANPNPSQAVPQPAFPQPS